MRWSRVALTLAAVAVVLVLLWLLWDQTAVMALSQQARPLPFFAMMALFPCLGVPITPFFILAGATFGEPLGVLGSLSALTVNLTLCYWLGRSPLRRGLERLLRRSGYELPDFEEQVKSP